eukprot:341857-Rhodomonas_salina.1
MVVMMMRMMRMMMRMAVVMIEDPTGHTTKGGTRETGQDNPRQINQGKHDRATQQSNRQQARAFSTQTQENDPTVRKQPATPYFWHNLDCKRHGLRICGRRLTSLASRRWSCSRTRNTPAFRPSISAPIPQHPHAFRRKRPRRHHKWP